MRSVFPSVDSGWSGEVVEYLGQVEAVCDYCGNDWYRVYLLRALNKQAGLDCVLGVMNTPRWAWVFPPEVLRLQVHLRPSHTTIGWHLLLFVSPRAHHRMYGEHTVLKKKIKTFKLTLGFRRKEKLVKSKVFLRADWLLCSE